MSGSASFQSKVGQATTTQQKAKADVVSADNGYHEGKKSKHVRLKRIALCRGKKKIAGERKTTAGSVFFLVKQHLGVLFHGKIHSLSQEKFTAPRKLTRPPEKNTSQSHIMAYVYGAWHVSVCVCGYVRTRVFT